MLIADRESLVSNLIIPKLDALVDGVEDPYSLFSVARSSMVENLFTFYAS